MVFKQLAQTFLPSNLKVATRLLHSVQMGGDLESQIKGAHAHTPHTHIDCSHQRVSKLDATFGDATETQWQWRQWYAHACMCVHVAVHVYKPGVSGLILTQHGSGGVLPPPVCMHG